MPCVAKEQMLHYISSIFISVKLPPAVFAFLVGCHEILTFSGSRAKHVASAISINEKSFFLCGFSKPISP